MIALRMLTQDRARLAVTLAGIGFAFFLSTSQVGLLVGWCNTLSAIIGHADADVWVLAKQTAAFDFGTAIPRTRVYQVRSTEGVEWAEAMFMAWNIWQRPDGRRVNIGLIGLDEGCAGGPWKMIAGSVSAVHRPDTVLVDELYLGALGVSGLGQEVEMIGNRAVVGGICQGVRTFTASPYIFTSIESAIRYDKRYRDDEITYVLARCAPGYTPVQVRENIAREIPDAEVLLARDFAIRSVAYWMLETGAGISVVCTAALGLLVGAFIISQNLFAITQEHITNYATLAALGFGRRQLTGIVLAQSLFLGGGGILLGSLLFFVASYLSRTTPIPLETTPLVFAGLASLSALSCVIASLASLRSIFRIDPVSVFRV